MSLDWIGFQGLLSWNFGRGLTLVCWVFIFVGYYGYGYGVCGWSDGWVGGSV